VAQAHRPCQWKIRPDTVVADLVAMAVAVLVDLELAYCGKMITGLQKTEL
jgi:hypothetical protein